MKKICVVILILIPVLVMLTADDSAMLYCDSELAEIEITVDQNALIWMYENVWSDSLHSAEMHYSNSFIDETVSDVGFRLRGNTSRVSYKKSFKLSFNGFEPGREFYGIDKINLNGEHNDPSIIRSKLCWDLFQAIGVRSSRASYAAVNVNEMYFGLYVSVEHIDDKFLERNFTDPSGNLWKCNYLSRLNYLGTDPELYKFTNNGSRVYELKTNEGNDDYSELARLIEIINNTPQEYMPDSLETIIDIPGVLKYFAVNVLTGSWDDYWYGKNNYYIYHEPAEDRFYIIPYDYDNTFGVDWMDIDWTLRDIYQFKHPDSDRPLADVFMENDEYRNLYTHFVEYYSGNLFDLPLWESRIDSLKAMITPYAETDIYRTLDYGFSIEDFHDSYSEESYENQHVKNGLKEFINLRNASLAEQIEYLPASPVLYAPYWQKGDSLLIEVSAFSPEGIVAVNAEFYVEDAEEPEIYDLEFSPVAGTKLVEDSDRWIGEIPLLSDIDHAWFRLKATDENGLIRYYPRSGRIRVNLTSTDIEGVYINEFLALNETVNFDEAGEYDDWLELYNASGSEIDLSGCYLTDSFENPDKWQIPDGVVIPSQDYLVFWCDEDQEQGELHTNFKISGSGEFLGITAGDGITVIDSISFSEQTEDLSFGRSPDGIESWEFMQPTPGTSNHFVAKEFQNVRDDIYLSNYPNPFNPETSINFSFSGNGNYSSGYKEDMKIAIYNVKGQLVRDLKVRNEGSRMNSVVWDGKDEFGNEVSSAIYFYNLEIGGKIIRTNKCLLLR